MPFRKLPDNRGLIYVPECSPCRKKHPCPDCFSCQQCVEERCRVCRPRDYGAGKKRKSKENGDD